MLGVLGADIGASAREVGWVPTLTQLGYALAEAYVQTFDGKAIQAKTEEMIRDGIHLRTEARCRMWSDATTFHLAAELEAWEGDRLILSREVREAVPRDHL